MNSLEKRKSEKQSKQNTYNKLRKIEEPDSKTQAKPINTFHGRKSAHASKCEKITKAIALKIKVYSNSKLKLKS